MSDKAARSADQAADLFIHYFREITERGLTVWDGDHSAEIRTTVDRLMDAARDIVREEVAAHLESEPHLYTDGAAS